jgi:hypothetical protein
MVELSEGDIEEENENRKKMRTENAAEFSWPPIRAQLQQK